MPGLGSLHHPTGAHGSLCSLTLLLICPLRRSGAFKMPHLMLQNLRRWLCLQLGAFMNACQARSLCYSLCLRVWELEKRRRVCKLRDLTFSILIVASLICGTVEAFANERYAGERTIAWQNRSDSARSCVSLVRKTVVNGCSATWFVNCPGRIVCVEDSVTRIRRSGDEIYTINGTASCRGFDPADNRPDCYFFRDR